MATYAFINSDNIVTGVIPGRDEKELSIDWEEYYGQTMNTRCKRTSYNTLGGQHLTGGVPFRMNYAGVGYTFREDLNAPEGAFVPPQPYPSWTFNETTCLWDAPTPRPESNQHLFTWDEDSLSWVRINS